MTDFAMLIDRLEKATEPSRELDSLIAQALETYPTVSFKDEPPFWRLKGMYWVIGKKDTPNGPVEERWSKNPPLYTFSIDNALMLLPKTFTTDVHADRDQTFPVVFSLRQYHTGSEKWSEATVFYDTEPIWNIPLREISEGASSAGAPIALCIAAIRAKAVITSGE